MLNVLALGNIQYGDNSRQRALVVVSNRIRLHIVADRRRRLIRKPVRVH
jgi:hypothetical protein